ncbi:DUF551 domain-containing protein [Klebsiella pneumoniae]|nr:DUF551 domain-containing protein [Klebsiella pneumoniae]MBL0826726.1 DUF551 domain-containing protein [Klebsiella pneumoniae]
MTKSTITREESVQAVFDLKVGYRLGFADIEILKRVARMALAAMDSEPDRNPVLAYADSYRDMAKQGVESVPIWSVITDLERNIAPLYRHAQPALVIPDEMTAEQAYEIGYYYGDPVDVFARGANWMRQHIIDSTLAAAPQSPGSDPATVPGKWIPVSERIPDNTEPVLCIEKRADFGTYGQPFVCWHDGGGWVGKTNYRPIVTHWMPLPAAPQEVKSES